MKEKYRTKQSKKKKKPIKLNNLSYYPDQSELNNCLVETELA